MLYTYCVPGTVCTCYVPGTVGVFSVAVSFFLIT